MQGTRIIQDLPAEVDEFGGKGHDRTANALVDAINQLEGTDGAIGLEGSWGAGKSTVIKIAEKKLAERDRKDLKHSIFTFDLWAHQSDDFRRAFLESFLAWLTGQNILSSRTLDDARDEIRDRVKSVTVESSKKYNAFGIVFILILPLLPFIYSWLSPSALKTTTGALSSPDWPFYVAVSLIVFLYGSVIYRFCTLFFMPTWAYSKWPIGRTGKSFADAASNCVSMFSKDVESETTKQNIRETDPTTIEFHRIFRSLLGAAQSRGIAVIHVLDNIDRLPQDSVAKTWSEIRALFAIRGGPIAQPHDNVLVVLPYDKKFVMNALKEEEEEKETDFIEKTFSRTLRVAPPISHDWRGFFISKLRECFANIVDEELNERLFRLLRYSFQKTNTHASPRRIIHFINELGALDSQWKGTISIEACAVYILNRKKIEASSDSLQKNDTIDLRYVQIANVDDIHREIAALAFNVEPSAANQVLLQDPIAKALISADIQDLQKLKLIPGFHDVLQDVLQDPSREWLLTPKGVLDRVCVNLAAIELGEAYAKVCWRDVAKDIQTLKESVFPDIDVINALSLAIPGVHNSRTAPELARKIQSILGGNQSEIDEVDLFDYGVDWFLATTTIQNSLKSCVSDEVFKEFRKQTEISLSPDAIIGCAYQCAQSGDYKLSLVHRTNVDRTKLEQSFLEVFNSNPSIAVEVLEQLSTYFSEKNFKQLLTEILKVLKTTALASDDEQSKRSALLHVAKMLCAKIGDGEPTKWKELVAPLAHDGSLAVHAENSYDAEDKSSSAQAVAILMALQDSTKPYQVPGDHPNLGNSAPSAVRWFNSLSSEGTEDDELRDLIAKASPDIAAFGDWLKRGLQDTDSPKLHQQVLQAIIRSKNFRRLSCYDTLLAYPKIKDFVGDDEVAYGFLRKLEGWQQWFGNFINKKETLLALPSALITDIHAKASDTKLVEILDAVDKVLSTATHDDWKLALAEENDLLRLYILRRRDTSLSPSVSEYRPALRDHALLVLKGEMQIELSKQEWKTVVDGLGQNNQTTLAGEILLALSTIVVNEAGLIMFIENYGEIANRMKYLENPNVSLNQIFSKLIVSQIPSAQSFVDQRLEEIDLLLDAAQEESKGAFIETIKSQLIQDDANGNRLRDLRTRFNIIEEEKHEENGDDNAEQEEVPNNA